MELWGHKLIALLIFLIFIPALYFLSIPVTRLVKKKGSEETSALILSCFTCFGGGVFLGLFLLHALHEVQHMIEHELPDVDYPVGEVIVAAGFFFFMLIEVVIDKVVKKHEESITITPNNGGSIEQKNGDVLNVVGGSAVEVVGGSAVQVIAESDPEEHGGKAAAAGLLISLTVESFIESLTLGLTHDINDMWIFFAGVFAHEAVIGFCLGIEFYKLESKKWMIAGGIIYGLIPPIAIAIGIGITEGGSEADMELAMAIFLGIAAGVFLHCTFICMLSKHIVHGASPWKHFSVFLGFLLMAALVAIPHGEHHDH